MTNSAHTGASEKQMDVNQWLGKIDAFFEEYLVKKTPVTIPDKWKEILVKVYPYLNVLFIILAVPAILMMLGVGAFLGTVGMVANASVNGLSSAMGIVSIVLSVVALVLQILAAKGLFARKAAAWRLMFYAQLVGIVQTVLYGQIVGALLGIVIGMYLLYQVKEKYTA